MIVKICDINLVPSRKTLEIKEKLLDLQLARLMREEEASDRRLAILLNDPEMSWKKDETGEKHGDA